MLVTITRTIEVNPDALLRKFRADLTIKYGGALTDQAIADILTVMAETQQKIIDLDESIRARRKEKGEE